MPLPRKKGGESTGRKSPKQIAVRLGDFAILPLEFAVVEKDSWFLQISVAQCVLCGQELRSRARPGSQGFYNSKLQDHRRACKGLLNITGEIFTWKMNLSTLYKCSLCGHLSFDRNTVASHTKRHDLKKEVWDWCSNWNTPPNIERMQVVASARELIRIAWNGFLKQKSDLLLSTEHTMPPVTGSSSSSTSVNLHGEILALQEVLPNDLEEKPCDQSDLGIETDWNLPLESGSLNPTITEQQQPDSPIQNLEKRRRSPIEWVRYSSIHPSVSNGFDSSLEIEPRWYPQAVPDICDNRCSEEEQREWKAEKLTIPLDESHPVASGPSKVETEDLYDVPFTPNSAISSNSRDWNLSPLIVEDPAIKVHWEEQVDQSKPSLLDSRNAIEEKAKSFAHYEFGSMDESPKLEETLTNLSVSVGTPSNLAHPLGTTAESRQMRELTPPLRDSAGCSFSEVNIVEDHQKSNRRRRRTEPTDLQPEIQLNDYTLQLKKLKVHNYRGLSIAFLEQFWGRVQRMEEAPMVLLYVTKCDIKWQNCTISEGETFKLLYKTLNRWQCWSPMFGKVTVRPHQLDFKPRERWTSQDLEDYVVRGVTMAQECCYTELLLHSPEQHLREAVGPEHRGAFVIQARRTPFQELLDALKTYYTTTGSSTASSGYDNANFADKFVWIDIFGENHALVQQAHQKVDRENFVYLKGGVHDAISEFGECLLVLNSWESPLTLQRAWCLWELYGAVERGIGFNVCLTDEVAAQFTDVLLHEYDTLIRAILNVNLSIAKCSNYAEEVEIHHCTRGKTALIEKLVQEQLRKWFVQTAEMYADDALESEQCDPDPEFVVLLLSRTARLLKDQGQYSKAESRYDSAVCLAKEKLPSGHYLLPSCITGLAGVFASNSKYKQAENKYKQALGIFQTYVPDGLCQPERRARSLDELHDGRGQFSQRERRVDQAQRAAGVDGLPAHPQGRENAAPKRGGVGLHLVPNKEMAVSNSGLERALHLSSEGAKQMWIEYATALHDYGTLLCIQAKYRVSLVHFDKALCIRGTLRGKDHPEYAETLGTMAECHHRQGRYAVAERLYVAAGTITRRVLGADHPDVATNLHNLAELYEIQGKYSSALQLLRKALEIREKTVGKEHGLYAGALISTASVLQKLGRVNEAQLSLQVAVGIQKRTLGSQHESYAMCLAQMGHLLTLQGKYAEAEKQFRAALEIRQSNLGAEHELYARTLNDLAEVLQKQGNYIAVEELYAQAEGILKQVLGAGFELHESRATILTRVAELYVIQGKYQEAEVRFRQALAIRKQVLGENHELYARSLTSLGNVLLELNQLDNVEALHRRALQIKSQEVGEMHESFATTLVALAKYCAVQQRFEEAENMLRHALQIRLASLGGDHELYAQCLDILSQVLLKLGKLAEAQTLQSDALKIKRNALGPGHESYATGLRTMADLKESLGLRKDAEELHCQALQINTRALGSDHPKATESRVKVAAMRALAKCNASPDVPLRQQPAHVKEEFDCEKLFLDFDRDITNTLNQDVLVAGMKRMHFPAQDPKETARRLMRSCAKNPENGKISREEFNVYFKKVLSTVSRIRGSVDCEDGRNYFKSLKGARENGMFQRTDPTDSELHELANLINDRESLVKAVICSTHQDLDGVLEYIRSSRINTNTE